MVKVQRYISIDNGYGGSKLEWVDLLEVPGVIDMLQGDEVITEDKIGRKSTHIFICFDIVDIQEGDRLIAGSNKYRVKYADNPMGLDRHMEVLIEWEGVHET